jgi:replicative DNA helicase
MQVWRPASDNIPASFVELVANTGELYMNEVTILAARPAMGKTAMAISMAENLVFNGTPVLFCSLEMTTERVTMRLLSSMTGIAIESIKSGHLSDIEKGRLRHAGTILGTMDNFYITGMASPSCGELEARIEEKVEEVGQCMVIIDYFGLIKTETSDWKEKDSVAFNLQSLTKRLPIGMILLAQLSRNVETRGGSKRPQMSDLRETGALEMIADKIFFLYRPEYYGILEDENNNTTKGITELIVAKARDNALVTVSMRFIPSAMRFVDIPGGTKTGAVSSAPTKKPRPAYAVAPTPKAMPLSVTDEPSVPFRPINTDDLPF